MELRRIYTRIHSKLLVYYNFKTLDVVFYVIAGLLFCTAWVKVFHYANPPTLHKRVLTSEEKAQQEQTLKELAQKELTERQVRAAQVLQGGPLQQQPPDSDSKFIFRSPDAIGEEERNLLWTYHQLGYEILEDSNSPQDARQAATPQLHLNHPSQQMHPTHHLQPHPNHPVGTVHHVPAHVHQPVHSSPGDGLKTILLWNSLFDADDYRFGIGQLPFQKHKCAVQTCKTTTDKRDLHKSNAIMFHGPIIKEYPPPERFAHQLYAYIQLEPHIDLSSYFMSVYHGEMNLTISHRRDADIWVPYGRFYNSKSPQENPAVRREVVSPLKRPKSIVWVVSHCNTTAKREMYVKELQKHIDVDIYGECGTLSCPKTQQQQCYEMFEKTYRYVLAFENNNCIDYATEKLYRPLQYNIIPIVFGGANYSELAPPHSVINIKDHLKPKALADFLKRLGNSPAEYRKYFDWKQKYIIERDKEVLMGKAFCTLCEILHTPNFPVTNYHDLSSWWIKGTCESQFLHKMRKKNGW